MAAFTSKATGNWNADGQTTWNEAGVPDLGDTVTINSPHVVTVPRISFVGYGTDTTLTIASGAELAIADSAMLYVGGAIDNQGNITEGNGSAIVFATITRGVQVALTLYN